MTGCLWEMEEGTMGKLTTTMIKRFSEPGRYADGGNLYLYISPGGTRSWVVRFQLNGRRIDRGLGGWPGVALPKARRLAVACIKGTAFVDDAHEDEDVDDDDAPVTLAPGAVPTFREAAMLKHALKVDSGEIANAKSARNWLQVMARHTFPVLGDKPVDQVTRRDVIAVLEPIWRNLPETAKRVRHRTREVMAWAVGRDYLTNAAFLELDPAGVGVTDALGKRRHKATHFASMPYGDVSHAIAAIEMSRGIREVRLALRLLILTAARSGEVRGMRWDELNDDRTVWTIPAERMKAGREHRIPLSEQARLVLREAEAAVAQRRKRNKDYDPAGLVFPSPSSRPLSDAAMRDRIHKLGFAVTVHGFRSSFRDWAEEHSGASHTAIEMSLAHHVGSQVEQAYLRADLLDLRRDLMQQWSDFVDALPF